MTLKVAATISSGKFSVTVDYEAKPGITALFGPSGAGKSVSLNAVAGLLRPESWSISFDGMEFANAHDSVHIRTQDRKIGLVSQHAALLSHLSPLDNVALALLNSHDRGRRHMQAKHWLDRVQAALREVEGNFNATLVLEGLLIQWQKLFAAASPRS